MWDEYLFFISGKSFFAHSSFTSISFCILLHWKALYWLMPFPLRSNVHIIIQNQGMVTVIFSSWQAAIIFDSTTIGLATAPPYIPLYKSPVVQLLLYFDIAKSTHTGIEKVSILSRAVADRITSFQQFFLLAATNWPIDWQNLFFFFTFNNKFDIGGHGVGVCHYFHCFTCM